MEPGLDFEKTMRDWEASLRAYKDYTQKSAAEVLNKKGKDVIANAIRLTPAADGAKIREQLMAPPTRTRGTALAYALIRKTKQGGTARSRVREKGKRNSELKSQMLAYVRARVASRNYIKAGFMRAFEVVGGTVRRLRAGKLADRSYGRKATTFHLAVEIVNKTVGAVTIAGPALAKAMDANREDTMEYLKRKLAEGWGKR